MAWFFPSHLTFKGALIALLLGLYGVSPAIAQKTGSIRVYVKPEEGVLVFFRGGALRVGCAHASAAKKDLVGALGRSFGDSLVVDTAYDDEGKLLGYAVVSGGRRVSFVPSHLSLAWSPTLACAVPACWSIAKATVPKCEKALSTPVCWENAGDPIRINRDIVNISGATMSVRALNFGVRKVLALTEHFYHTRRVRCIHEIL